LITSDQIDQLLPQTQCTKCGFDGCRPYAQAIAQGEAAINRCPPGGAETIAALALLTGQSIIELDTSRGLHRPLQLAKIDEALCIGCTLCIAACPVDAVLGAPKQMHVIIDDHCSGCDLCIPPCPVDCITMVDASIPWSPKRASEARLRHDQRPLRTSRIAALTAFKRSVRLAEHQENLAVDPAASGSDAAHSKKRAIIDAALARARARRAAADTTNR
jgi:electron transport complex protein RnfB